MNNRCPACRLCYGKMTGQQLADLARKTECGRCVRVAAEMLQRERMLVKK